jgi:hypothetical protein
LSKTFNLFVSHSWVYHNTYIDLFELLNARISFRYHNYSVPPDDPIHDAPNSAALYDAIKQQMSACHIVIVLAGVYATYSTWIKKEIQIAQKEFRNSKPIIGIKPRAQVNVSSVVQDAALEIVGWNTDSIIAAIRRHSL